VSFRLGFVIIIIISDTANEKHGRKTYVLLGYERGGKYGKYKHYLEVIVTGTQKCECPFKFAG